jgi:hypothetical protein
VDAVRDIVQVHISRDLPIRARALPFANRIEVRLGKAFPVALLIDQDALSRFLEALEGARSELDTAHSRPSEG